MNVIICDDEQVYLESIRQKIITWATREGHRNALMIYAFTSTEDLWDEWIHGLQMDALFLDIQIPSEMNGMEMAKQICVRDSTIPIVFFTNYAEYALDGYKVNALRYLRKPVRAEDINECMDIMWRQWQFRSSNDITFEVPGHIYRLPASSIVAIEVVGRTIMLTTTDSSEQIALHLPIGKVYSRLPSELFVRCHRAYIVNLMYVRRFTSHTISLADGTDIPVGRTYQHGFVERFRDFYRGRNRVCG